LLTGDLDASIADYSFYTIRHGMDKDYPMSKGLWTTSAIASGCGNEAVRLFIQIYDRYFEKHDNLIDYLLTDYIFAVCCDNCSAIKDMFEQIPMNNTHVNEMLSIMNSPYEKDEIGKLGATYMNKLSWKQEFMESSNGRITTYGYYKKLYGDTQVPN